MSFTVHVTLVTTPELLRSKILNQLEDNFRSESKCTSEGDFYGWSMHNKAIHDPFINALFDYVINSDNAVVQLVAPELNDDVDVF